MKKFKKISFKQLKKLILQGEEEFYIEMCIDNKTDYEQGVKELNMDFKDIHTLGHLIGWYEGEGYDVEEAMEMVLKYLVKLPKE